MRGSRDFDYFPFFFLPFFVFALPAVDARDGSGIEGITGEPNGAVPARGDAIGGREFATVFARVKSSSGLPGRISYGLASRCKPGPRQITSYTYEERGDCTGNGAGVPRALPIRGDIGLLMGAGVLPASNVTVLLL